MSTARLGVYELESRLGAGGMGEVFAARDTRLNRRVALKVLPADGDDGRRQRLLMEARAASALSHPAVVTIYDIGEADGVSYIAMELVDGRTLGDLLREHAFDHDRVLDIARQTADALQCAHDRGVVHRDIKASNVMITSAGQVKVLDFGIAKLTGDAAAADVTRDSPTKAGHIVGTVNCMSPEQALGLPVDHRTDLFSLGVLLYQLTTGRLPFSGTTDAQMVDAIRHSEPVPLGAVRPDCPVELERIIRKCLEKDRELRYQSARDLAVDVKALQRQASSARERGRAVPHNLPAELTSFIGRDVELAELPPLLRSSARLLSLVGAGGAGKTRLAIRVAASMLDDFPDGVWLIDLSPLTEAGLVPQTIATVLGIREGQNRSVRDALLELLRPRRLLIVLDNCEHLVNACADIAGDLLQAATALRILATSREPLGVTGETVRRVRSLSVPDDAPQMSADAVVAFDATRLFIERARAIDPTVAATEQNAATIARICRRLDGIPLAIELAAARAAVLSFEQIDNRLRDRFRLLTAGTRTAVPRQRTLEATVDWSYQLLSDQERVLLARLSVFPSSWTLEAAEQVCGGAGIEATDVLDLLSRLVEKSLVVAENDAASGRRYRMLETVRQYARDRLAQDDATDGLRERHFEYFFAEFGGSLPLLRGHQELLLLRRLRTEEDSIRAALEYALELESRHIEGVTLATALFWYWTKRGLFREGRQWLERALGVHTPIGDALRARASIGLAHMYYFQGMMAEAAACNAEALRSGRLSGDGWSTSSALFFLGLGASEHGDLEAAEKFVVEARAAADDAGEPILHGGPLMVLGNIALGRGDPDEAQRLYDESIAVHRLAGESWGIGILLSISASLRVLRGKVSEASALALDGISVCHALEDPRGIAWNLEALAGAHGGAGRDEDAAQLWGASDGLLEMVGGTLLPTIAMVRNHSLMQVRDRLGAERFAAAHARGKAMRPNELLAFARALA